MESIKNIPISEWRPAIQKASIAGTVLSALGLMGIIWAKRRGVKLPVGIIWSKRHVVPKVALPITAAAGLFSIGGILVSRKVDPSVFAIERLIGESIKKQPIQEICKKIDNTSIEKKEKIELIKNLVKWPRTFLLCENKPSSNSTAPDYIAHFTSNFLYANEENGENTPKILYLALVEYLGKSLLESKNTVEIRLNCNNKCITWEPRKILQEDL